MFKNSKVVAQPTTWENGAKQYIKHFKNIGVHMGGDRHFKNKMENVMVYYMYSLMFVFLCTLMPSYPH